MGTEKGCRRIIEMNFLREAGRHILITKVPFREKSGQKRRRRRNTKKNRPSVIINEKDFKSAIYILPE